MTQICYRRHRFPGAIIQHAVWLYFRFPLSYRDVEDLLSERGIDVTLICDSMAAQVMREGRVQAVVTGADRIAANGDVANKIGTYKLAVVAKENGIPFYPVVPTSTVDLTLANGDLRPIEERTPEEDLKAIDRPIAPEGISARNPAFDVTPHRYVTGIVTEVGIIYPPFEKHLQQAVEASHRGEWRQNN